MGKVMQMQKPVEKLLNRLRKTKEITSEVIRQFCSIRADSKRLESEKKELAEAIKEVMVDSKQFSSSFPDCPFSLTVSKVKYKPVTEVDYESITAKLAAQLYGPGWKKDKRYTKLKSHFTSTTRQAPTWRLNEPEQNPDYRD